MEFKWNNLNIKEYRGIKPPAPSITQIQALLLTSLKS